MVLARARGSASADATLGILTRRLSPIVCIADVSGMADHVKNVLALPSFHLILQIPLRTLVSPAKCSPRPRNPGYCHGIVEPCAELIDVIEREKRMGRSGLTGMASRLAKHSRHHLINSAIPITRAYDPPKCFQDPLSRAGRASGIGQHLAVHWYSSHPISSRILGGSSTAGTPIFRYRQYTPQTPS